MGKKKTVSFTVNGQEVTAEAKPKFTLLDFLRKEMGLMGTKNGCSQGHCGTCTVLVNGKAELACLYKMTRLANKKVLTIEGLAEDGRLHPLQQAFVEHGALQCGFCTPGMIMAAKALLDRTPSPTDDEIKEALNKCLCRCGVYPKAIQAVQAAAAVLRGQALQPASDFGARHDVVGHPVPRKEGPAKVRGEFLFADDMTMEGMIHAKVVWSEYPHADILSIDTTAAEALPGVVAVLTAKDVPGRNAFGTLQPDQPVLCDTRVRYMGDAVALVMAESEEIAEQARRLVRVEYQELPGVFSPDEALAEGAPLVHEQGNVHAHLEVNKGDIGEGFAQADVIIEGTYTTPFIEHAFLEPEAGLAAVDDEGLVTIWMASQFVYGHRPIVAQALGLPPEKVRLIHVPPGGSFGARNDISLHILLALAALHTRRPVKMVLSRQESMRCHVKRHAMKIEMKTGATKEGKLTALEARIVADTGAYASVGIVVLGQAVIFAGGPYQIPHVAVKGDTVYTNNVPGGAMRGFGIPQVAFATELQMEKLARELDMDPFEIRRLNGLQVGSVTTAGQTLRESVALMQTLDLAEEASRDLPAPRRGKKQGIGVASCYKNVGVGLGLHMDYGGAVMELAPDGRIVVRVGGVDLGQGSDTALAQIAAQTVGVPFDQVEIMPVDTVESPDGGVTSASRTTYISGNAVLLAGQQFKESMLSFVAGRHKLKPSQVILENGRFTDTSTGQILRSVADLAGEGKEFKAEYRYDSSETYSLWPHGPPGEEELPKGTDFFFSYSYATQVAVVEVDEKTGEVEVVKMVAAHDVGRAINPQMLESQIEGSCLMGLGYALKEEFQLDRGRLVTDNLRKCRIPTFKDTPEIVTIIVEDPEPSGPFGAKGIAEAAAIPTAPAIINAIHDAVGVYIHDLPATPERVLTALKEAK